MIKGQSFSGFNLSSYSCQAPETPPEPPSKSPYLLVLGIAQDAGYPQAGCAKDCCRAIWENPEKGKKVTCLGLVDPQSQQTWLLEATPDFRQQLYALNRHSQNEANKLPDGILLTHAHIGHYTGLMHLGHEAMGAQAVPVWAMPQMRNYLSNNGPWSQLVRLKNIEFQKLKADSTIQLNERLQVTPFRFPHRDEYSETVGYKITGPQYSALFIPDIDKWDRWDRDIREVLKGVDWAFLDGTFYSNGEIPGRDMALIPHPFIEESRELFSTLPAAEKAKIYFIHFNHTNPILQLGPEQKSLKAAGFFISEEGATFEL